MAKPSLLAVAALLVQVTAEAAGAGKAGGSPRRGRQGVTNPDPALLPTAAQGVAQVSKVAVRCTKSAMEVHVEFDGPFGGVIYSKGHFEHPECRHVKADAAPGPVFEFVIQADRCGSSKVERKNKDGESYIENTIVVQNEPRIQEWSDSARRLRCSWDSNIDRTVSSSISVNQLDVQQARYAGSSAADSYMDVQLGRGPFSPPVTGLVRIGDTLTLVVYTLGSDLDVLVKDCLAHDGDPRRAVQLTDARGCVAKPKLLGPWQKTSNTGSTGASTIAFAYLKAFKFPDKVEVYLECNIEMCRRKCAEPCQAAKSKRSRRQLLNESAIVEPARVARGIRVVAPDDLDPLQRDGGPAWAVRPPSTGDVCLSLPGFVTALSAVLAILLSSCVLSALLYLRVRQLASSDGTKAKAVPSAEFVRKVRRLP
ncbi:hypothetical protein HPB48_020143 [Haemaphysalis longicornis]|uniref:ZP domain-containing protein n=1 Tax=Haemaphysalis longicornis TaxID=44386 RepID=A0A9J6FI04_HAELO|nr:hypothetical protein HPB48_020143 [Haemaphysalis longicornis]